MSRTFIDAHGTEVVAADLTGVRARALAHFLMDTGSPFATLIECRRDADPPAIETVVVEVEVQRPQVRVHDIHRTERLAVSFSPTDDEEAPEVVALRVGFPVVPHLNLRPAGHPPSLCLSELTWDAQKLRWTPATLVEQIRTWLAMTAIGKLHAADQVLEPLVASSSYQLVIPHDFYEGFGVVPDRLLVTRAGIEGKVFLASRADPKVKAHGAPYLAMTVACKPQRHGVIRHAPSTLKGLHELLALGGLDLIGELRRRMRAWSANESTAKLVILAILPAYRETTSAVEATDFRAFICDATVARIGEEVGAWARTRHGMGHLLSAEEDAPGLVGDGVRVDVMIPMFSFSRATGARVNGLSDVDGRKVTCVGAGALGSQVAMNLARAGVGEWTVIDGDHLLPHNLARHALTGDVGFPKAQLLALEIGRLHGAAQKSIVADLLHPAEKAVEVALALAGADAILDFSASVPVARHLARSVDARARRVSAYLNPTGSDLVVLAEDAERNIPLDCLEMQYYRAAAARDDLEGHMHRPEQPVRYAQSCRDVTSTISQELVALHAAAAARAIRQALAKPSASIGIWRADPQTLALQAIALEPSAVRTMRFGEWTLLTDDALLGKIEDLRQSRLPNETGGVLLGSYDLHRKCVYVVDTIHSPPDSQEWPTLYIRGADHLPRQVEEAGARTGQNLEYVGEWHSHPRGFSCEPSVDDRVVFAWLVRSMDVDGLPALMLIAGDGGAFQLFLGRMT